MSTPRHQSQIIRLSDQGHRQSVEFLLAPGAPELAAIAAELNIPEVRQLEFAGRLTPQGRQDWQLDAKLGATVVQDCVVTLEPVLSRIDEEVVRRYAADLPDPGPGEIEMPQDDTLEDLPQALDLSEVMIEALALALPPYPRAPGVELGETVVTEPGAEPLTEETRKPFAALRDALKRKE